jgi:hypothetical protein
MWSPTPFRNHVFGARPFHDFVYREIRWFGMLAIEQGSCDPGHIGYAECISRPYHVFII